MRQLFAKGTLGILLLAGAAGAQAQYGPNREDRYREDRYRNDDYRDYRRSFYDRLQSDLDRAANNGYLRGGDLRRFEKARQEIFEFQQKWSRGRYDRHELDDAIGATQRVANLPGLDGRDRRALSEDLANMRAFRARMNGNGGYRPY
ncbi:MAG: hypothetical protein M3Z09_00080 [Acidobacteriota bacterium]|nr:hypothetical protein [Acidobacteriota bacterium]